MKWLKKLFNSSSKNCSNVETIVLEKVRDISEPVFSFVECVRNNPKRFVLTDDEESRTSTLTDKNTKEVFEFRILFWGNDQYNWWRCLADTNFLSEKAIIEVISPEFLTKDEKEYLFEELNIIYLKRRNRLSELRQSRIERKLTNERNRLKGVYCVNTNN